VVKRLSRNDGGVRNNERASDSDDSDDENDGDKELQRPPQVRRESLRRFYVEGVNPYDPVLEGQLPKPRNSSRVSSSALPPKSRMPAKAPSSEMVIATPLEKRLSNRSFGSTASLMRSGSTLWVLHPSIEGDEDFPPIDSLPAPPVIEPPRVTVAAAAATVEPRKNIAGSLSKFGSASGSGLLVMPSIPQTERGKALAAAASAAPATPMASAEAGAGGLAATLRPAELEERYWPGDAEFARLASVAAGYMSDKQQTFARVTCRQLLKHYASMEELSKTLVRAKSAGVADFKWQALDETTMPVSVRLRW